MSRLSEYRKHSMITSSMFPMKSCQNKAWNAMAECGKLSRRRLQSWSRSAFLTMFDSSADVLTLSTFYFFSSTASVVMTRSRRLLTVFPGKRIQSSFLRRPGMMPWRTKGFSRRPLYHEHLGGFARKPGEKCGIGESSGIYARRQGNHDGYKSNLCIGMGCEHDWYGLTGSLGGIT